MLVFYMSMVDTLDDKRKIEQLYNHYNKLMFSVAYKILHHHEDAEDAVIESWEKIILHLDKIDEIQCNKTKNFLVTIIRRTSIDLYRSKKKQIGETIEDFEESHLFAVKDQYLEGVETRIWINNLPPKYRDVLLLYYIHGMSYSEIAQIMSIPTNTVASQIMRGRNLLKKEEKIHD